MSSLPETPVTLSEIERQPRGKWMVSFVNSYTNASSKRQHLWEIDLRFALNSTPGWRVQGETASSLPETPVTLSESERQFRYFAFTPALGFHPRSDAE